MSATAVTAGLTAALAVVVLAARVRLVDAARPLPHRDGIIPPDQPRGPSRRAVVGAAAAIAAVAAILAGPGLTLALGGMAIGLIASRRRRASHATRASIEAAMPDAIELLVMSLHAGYSPAQAVSRLATDAPLPVRPAFAAVDQRLHRGSGFADGIAELTATCGRCALPLVNAMSTAMRDGLPLAPVLDRLTDEANASRRRQGEAAARRLPVRLSFPLVVCTLPSFVLLAIAPAVLGAISTLQGSTP